MAVKLNTSRSCKTPEKATATARGEKPEKKLGAAEVSAIRANDVDVPGDLLVDDDGDGEERVARPKSKPPVS